MRASFSPVLVAAFAALVYPAPAAADPAGDQLLASMDAAMNRAKTHQFDYEVINKEAGKPDVTMVLQVALKGEKRLLTFAAPADMKGTKILVLSPTQLYVYLPALGKVRRIASTTTDQGSFGLAFAMDDLATTSYGSSYTATSAGEDATTIKLVLTPKAGKEVTWARIEVTVAKDRTLPGELKYFDSQGKHLRTETRTNYSCEGAICSPGELTMVNHVSGTSTKLVRKKWRVNENLSDDLFSQRSLAQ